MVEFKIIKLENKGEGNIQVTLQYNKYTKEGADFHKGLTEKLCVGNKLTLTEQTDE